jgi:tRNA (guanine-N7-)-methyltransferase
MRLRYVKGAEDLIQKHRDWIVNDTDHKTLNLRKLYPQEQPLHLEVGTGKGQFLYTLATLHPEINYLGIEKYDSAIVKALYKQIETPLDNFRLLRADAIHLLDLFEPNSISRIYLNFSDPWPKARHEKRRLTNKLFLTRYETLLVPGGEIHFKTDNRTLFDYSVEQMIEYGMTITSKSYDYHKEETNIITTEFEDRFVSLGQPIHHLIARF